MIDYCTSKRIFSFIIALIGFSVLIFFVEEYAESDDVSDTKIKQYSETESQKGIAHSSSDCWLNEAYSVIQLCLPCSDFEVNAIKARHCLPTGYFDRLNCSTSGVLALRPCLSKVKRNHNIFWWFTCSNFIIMAVSSAAANKRKAFLDRNAYMRVVQQFE